MHQPQLANYGTPVETYRPSDLTVGVPINVYGRLVILTDCDLYTKEYYRSKYGIGKFFIINRILKSIYCCNKYHFTRKH